MQHHQNTTTTSHNTPRNGRQAWRASGRRFRAGLIAAILLMGLTTRVWATDGALDSSFGSGGKATTDFFDDEDYGQAVAIQADGKIVVAGSAYIETSWNVGVARYNTDGTLDTTFGPNSDGKAFSDYTGGDDRGYAVAIQADGKIVVAGTVESDFRVARFTANGELDYLFGNEGLVATDFFGGDDGGRGVAIQADGKIVVAGYAGTNFAVARYNTNGTLDTAFGSGGKVTTDFFSAYDAGHAVAIQADGKIVVAGSAYIVSSWNVGVARYNTDGTLDTTFSHDSDGKTFSDYTGGDDRGWAVAIQSDGKIVVAGNAGNDFRVVRFTANGRLDYAFGDEGLVATDFSGGKDDGFGVAIQADGKIVVAGRAAVSSTGNDFAVARYNTNGTLDPAFNGTGLVTTNFSGSSDDVGYGVAIQADGKIVVAGTASNATGDHDFAVARYVVQNSYLFWTK